VYMVLTSALYLLGYEQDLAHIGMRFVSQKKTQPVGWVQWDGASGKYHHFCKSWKYVSRN
jgi:hypothetical protein